MKTYLFVTIWFISLILCSCALLRTRDFPAKLAPEHIGTDPILQEYEDEFFDLSTQYDLTFSNTVSMGFTKIDRGNVIGLCTYGLTWREIDIDSDFFSRSSDNSNKALVFHELAHCYCNRGHDYGEDKEYPDSIIKILGDRFINEIPWSIVSRMPGYFEDNCPVSLMHPTIPSDFCLYHHFEEYKKEIFDRCDPW